jgi:tRNA threonylcarbamoyladenosine biosynthesis protein TsaB
MRVLSLDTTTRTCSVALVEDESVIGASVGDPALTHAERLPHDLLRLLEQAQLTLADVDLFAVAAGPGSFTGLRVGIAAIQGLAFVTRRRVVPVSALEALGQAASAGLLEGALVAAWMDARRRDVFSVLYRVTSAPVFQRGRLIEVDPPRVDDPSAVLARWSLLGTPDVFIGDGAVAFRDVISRSDRIRPAPPLAPVIGRVAVERGRIGDTVDPAGIQPLYVRRPDAEIARDERRARTARPQDA